MPFMKGASPVRRTLKYLLSEKVKLKEQIKIITISFNNGQEASRGARNFVFWNTPQVQYQNPEVQINVFKNTTPSPFMQLFLSSGEKFIVDLDGKSKEDIMGHVKKVFCLTEEEKRREMEETAQNPAYFGTNHQRWCICEVLGQVPCTSWFPRPEEERGKYKRKLLDEKE